MTKKLITLFILALTTFSNKAWSQLGEHNFDWVQTFGSINEERGYELCVDGAGNVITVGNLGGNADFDPDSGVLNLSPNGNVDLFIQKLNSEGNLVWAGSLGGNGYELATSLTSDNDRNMIVTGYFSSTMDFDPGPGVETVNFFNGGYDVFVLKLDSAGAFQWVNTFGNYGSDRGQGIVVDDSGNVVVVGYFEGSMDVDPSSNVQTLTSNGDKDIFIIKYSHDGNLLWAKSIGGSGDDEGNDIAINHNGDVSVTGYFQGTIDLDPGVDSNFVQSNGGSDIFISTLDANGDFLWGTSFGSSSTGPDFGVSIHFDHNDNLLNTGRYTGTTDFDPGPDTFFLSPASFSPYILKLNPQGEFIFAKHLNGGGGTGRHVSCDIHNNILLTGEYVGTMDIDPDSSENLISSTGAIGMFAVMLDSNGLLEWGFNQSGAGADCGFAVEADNANNLFYTGFFGSTVDFDPTPNVQVNASSNGNSDFFVQKFSYCPKSYSFDTLVVCDSITWVDGNTYFVSDSNITHILENVAGCDSIMALNLQVNYSSNSSIFDTSCIFYNAPDGQQFTESGQYNLNLTNAYGCDSNIVLNLIINSVNTNVSKTGQVLTALADSSSFQWLNCEPTFTILSGDTSNSLSVTVKGSYAVEVTSNGCVDTSACFDMDPLGSFAPPFFDANIFPNPITNHFYIESSYPVNYRILDMFGRTIQNGISQPQSPISVSDLKAGVYIIELESKNALQTELVILQ